MGELDSSRFPKVTGRLIVPLITTLAPEKPKSRVEIGVGLRLTSFILSRAVLKMMSLELPFSISI